MSDGSEGSPKHSTFPLTLGSTAPGFHGVLVGLGGLTVGSAYCAELIAVNGSGTSAGSQRFFTAGTPSVSAFGPRAIGSTNELVEGEVNSAGQSTQYHVAYDLASSEWCTSHGSKGSPGHATSVVTLGFMAPKFRRVSVGLSGLMGGSEYCEELVAANPSGTSSGFTQTFTAGAPSVEGRGSRAIASTTELVNGQVNPASQSTQYHVAYDLASSEWCTSSGSKGSPTHATSPLPLGSTAAKSHPVSVGLSGLTAGSEYCEELIAANASGTSTAFQPSFTAGVPSVEARGSRAIGSTNELVEGEVNSAGQSTQYHIAYDLASSEWCTSHGSKGSPGHATSLVTLGSTAAKSHLVSVGLSGLTAGSQYCDELIAANASGASVGFQRSFIAGAPSAFAFGPQSTETTTTVGGEVNPAGQSTQYHVAYDLAISEWCTSRGLVSSPAHTTAPVTLGFTDATYHQVSVELTGLMAGSEYCEELIAANGSGTSAGFQQSFTAGAPSAFAFGLQSTGATTATVTGQVNPSGQTTEYHVAYDLASSEWCTSSGLAGSPAQSTSPVTLGFTDATSHQVLVELIALTGGSEYCVELIAVNGSGTSEGYPQSFTVGAPSAFAFGLQSTGATTATVTGQVNPSGQTTEYHVAYDLASSEWCTSSGLAGSPAQSTSPVTLGFTDATSHQVSVELTGLGAGNEYCAELIAVNGSGTGYGSAEFFFAGLPAASTSNAFATGVTTATVTGQVNPSGQTTEYHVAYDLASSEWCTSSGLAGSPAQSTSSVTLGFTDATSHQVSVELTGLSAGNEYCVELVTVNGSGAAHGSQITFFAGFPAASTSNAFATGATTAMVEGQVNPSGQTTQYQVAYDLGSSEWCASEGLADAPAHSTAPVTLGFTDAVFHQVSVELTGLNAGSEYCVELVAVNGSGTAHGSQLRFTAAPPMPAVTKVSPASGTTAGGTFVTIIGTSLEGATSVHFGAASATITTNTATEITAESPAHAGGQVDVTVTTPGGTSATSEADHYIYVGVPEAITPPKISGTAQQGKTLTEEHGNWTNEPITSYKLQWLQCSSSGTECKEITGATGQTYVPLEGDVGHRLKVEEKAINNIGEAKPAISAATAELLPHEPVDETPPKITGTAQQGKALTEHHGSWENSPTRYELQWLQCNSLGEACLPISHATEQTYVPVSGDVGHTLRVQETATNAGGSGAPAESIATATVKSAVPVNMAVPTVTGTAEKGQTLAESHGSWTNEPTNFVYQWLRCSSLGTECSAIASAVNQTYLATSSDISHTLEVQETASNAAGAGAPADSKPTAVVTAIPLHAVAGEGLNATVGVPVTFDGSGSTPPAEIEKYRWEFGDGSSGEGESTSHAYSAPGTYKATLTVSRGLESDGQSLTVTVAPAPTHQVSVTTVDSGAHPIAGAEVLYVASNGTRTEAPTASNGTAVLSGLPDGADTVYAYMSGFQPAVGHVTVAGGEGKATITLASGEVATSILKSHEMDLKEIEEAGIDTHNPANQNVYEFEVKLAFIESPQPPVTFAGYINSDGEFVGDSGFGGAGGGCSPYECEGGGFVIVPDIIDGHPLIQWLILRGKAAVLKQFFTVSMVVQNLSPEPFKLTGGTATLNIPSGMSLAPTGKPQTQSQAVPDIPGDGSATTNWVVRGDKPGEYYLSANYQGKLQPFGAAINLEAELATPLHIWGSNALSLKVQADEGLLEEGIPYHVHIGVTNKADVPLYNVAIELDANTHEHFIFQPQQQYSVTVSELAPGQTVYAPQDILIPDGFSEAAFNPALSSAAFVGEKVEPGAGIEAVEPPPLYSLKAPDSGISNLVHLEWEPVPNAEGYEVFATPNLDTPFGESPDGVLEQPYSSVSVTRLSAEATNAYLFAREGSYYAVTALIEGHPRLEMPVIEGAPESKPPSMSLTIHPESREYVATGAGWLPGEKVDIYLDTAEGAHYIGTVVASPAGTFATPVTSFAAALALKGETRFTATERFPVVAMGTHGDAATITSMTAADLASNITIPSSKYTTDGGCTQEGLPIEPPRGGGAMVPTRGELERYGLSASGSSIVGGGGEKKLRLASVNWYGAEEADFVVGGLQCLSLSQIAEKIRALGFNSVRLPWSNAMFELNPHVCPGGAPAPRVAPEQWQPCIPPEVLAMNSDLVGTGETARKIFEATVGALSNAGLMVILDNHGTDAAFEPVELTPEGGKKADLDGIWWGGQYWDDIYGFDANHLARTARWIRDWEEMVATFSHNPLVVGADLRNEPAQTPYASCGGSGCNPVWPEHWVHECAFLKLAATTSDWPCAATAAGNAILRRDPRLLIFVEGTKYATDFENVVKAKLALDVPNRVVYSAHQYPNYGPPPWKWGGLPGSSGPVWIGELGASVPEVEDEPCPPQSNSTPHPGEWLTCVVQYVNNNELSWSWWPINGTESDGGINEQDDEHAREFYKRESYGVLGAGWDMEASRIVTHKLQQMQGGRPVQIAVLGDSYASGEGSWSEDSSHVPVDYYGGEKGGSRYPQHVRSGFNSDSASATDHCHRSPVAAGILLGAPEQEFVACSSASIDAIAKGSNGELSQLNVLSSADTEVLVSASGDSLNFTGVLAECLDLPKHPTDDQKCKTKIETELGKLKEVMEELKAKLIEPIIAKTNGAHVILLGYPHLFPEGGYDNGCNGLTAQRQRYLNDAADRVDKAMEELAADYSGPGEVEFFDSRPIFEGHAVCGQSDPYFNDLQYRDVLLANNCPFDYAAGKTDPYDKICSQSFHPNTWGYLAEALALSKVIELPANVPLFGRVKQLCDHLFAPSYCGGLP